MKIVREHLNEIKQNIEGTGLGALGLGKASIIKTWAEKKKDALDLAYDYTLDYAYDIHARFIKLRKKDLRTMPFPANKESFKYIDRVKCQDCMFNENGIIVSKDRKDFIKGITYDMKDDKIYSFDFVNHYLYYIALKYIADAGDSGVHDSNVINKIKLLAFPGLELEKNGYWDAVFQERNHTPLAEGTNRIRPRTYAINKVGLDYIEDHKAEFEK